VLCDKAQKHQVAKLEQTYDRFLSKFELTTDQIQTSALKQSSELTKLEER